MNLLKKNFAELAAILFITLAIYLSTRAMFHEGFFRTIDDVTPVRITHLASELRNFNWSNFPVRLGTNLAHGYGYFLYLFYSPLVYYVGALLMIFGHLSDIMATKAVYAFPLVIGPIIFYLSARIKFSPLPATLGAIAYSFFPYRGFDAYFRGGVGENWAMAFIPGVFAGLFLLSQKPRLGWIISSFFLCLTIISHNIAGVMTLGLALLYGVIFLFRNKYFWFSLALGMGLSAFFWLPSSFYLRDIFASTIPLNTTSILGTSLPFEKISMPSFSYLPGEAYSPIFFALLLVALVKIFLFSKKVNFTAVFWIGISLFLYLLLSSPMLWFWQFTLPISGKFQFTWRVLIILAYTIPLSFAYLLNSLKTAITKSTLTLFLLVLSLSFIPTFKPREYSYFYTYSAEDTGPCATTTFEEYFPTWVKDCMSTPAKAPLRLDPPAEISFAQISPLLIEASYHSDQNTTIEVSRYYFDGWSITIDGSPLSLSPSSPNGLIKSVVPRGDHTLKVSYRKPIIMWVADLITLASLLIMFYALTQIWKTRRIS